MQHGNNGNVEETLGRGEDSTVHECFGELLKWVTYGYISALEYLLSLTTTQMKLIVFSKPKTATLLSGYQKSNVIVIKT